MEWLRENFFWLVESFLHGACAGLVFTPIHNALWRRWVGEASGR